MLITLVINSLAAGGAERVMSIIANRWAACDAYSVRLITIEGANGDHYPLDPRVERVALDRAYRPRSKWQACCSLFTIVAGLRRALGDSRSDCVISFGYATNALTLLACAGTRIPVIVSERTDPLRHEPSPLWVRLRSLLYRRSSQLVVQTSYARDWALGLVPAERIHVIPNPVLLSGNTLPFMQPTRRRERLVVGVGRLTHEKGFDLLLQAFARCAGKHRDWRLVIVGDGDEREQLVSLARQLQIENRVDFVGQVKDVDRFLIDSDLFVLPSRYEGFPNALCEAMALGLPVVVADCSGGPREIVRDGANGILVPVENVESMAVAMDRLMSDDRERLRLGNNAVDVRERFGVDAVMDMWTSLLTRTCVDRDGKRSLFRLGA